VPEELRERVIQIVQRVLGSEVDFNDTRLELSSLKMLELVVVLETDFGVHIPESDPLASITSSVDSMVRYLHKLVRP
jgi:acyl carrier protein